MDMRRVQLSAAIYVGEYGPNAARLATQNVQTLMSHGDPAAAAEWQAVVKEIEKMTIMARQPSDS